METRSKVILPQILEKCWACVFLLLSVRLCSMKCSAGVLLSSFELEPCPSTSTINAAPASTQVLITALTSIIQQSSSSMHPSTSDLMTTSSSITVLPTSSSSEGPVLRSSSEAPVLPTSSEVPVLRTSSEAPVLPTSSEAPVLRTSSEAPVLPTSSEAPVLRTSSEAPVLPTSSEAPVLRTSSEAPVLPTSSEAPVLRTSSEAPVLPTSSEAPVLRTSSEAPVLPTSSEAPVLRTSSEAPVLPTSSEAPVLRTSSEAPVLPTSSEAPVLPTSSEAPVLPISSEAPVLRTSSEVPVLRTSSEVPVLPTSSEGSVLRTKSEVPSTPTVSTTTSSISSTGISESVVTTLVPSMSLISTPEPTRTITEILMTSSAIPTTINQISTEVPSGSATTTVVSPTPSILDRIREFFDELSIESKIGFGVGGGVVLLLLIIILCFCCCCVRSRVHKKRQGRMDINNHRPSLTISNPSALIVNSRDSDEKIPARYRSTLHDSYDQSVDAIDMKEVDRDFLNFPSNEYRESAIDDIDRTCMTQPSQLTHPTQPSQMTQMSATTDLFREHSLPRLSPLTCSSQILTAPQFPTHRPSLSVDGNDPHTALGTRRRSLLTVIPNPSPSLNQPTLMALSLKNEESKSAHGSRASVQGSRTSIQGSRPSMLGSRGSVHTGMGSRSQIYSSNPSSREHSVLLLNGGREFGVSEEDALSLPLSGRGISPALKQNSFEEVPTRDSPAPEIASHAVGYGKKDFASLTCIPNQYAVEAERLEEKTQLSTVPEKQSIDEDKEKEVSDETKKKPRSRAMSKLEKLTSLDYIRASLRLKKKKVSFVKTPESVKKEKQKNDKAKASPEEKMKGQAEAPVDHTSPNHPGKELHHNRRHSASARTEFSPQHAQQQQQGGEHHLPANKYPDHYYYPQLQLSQPLYYGGTGGGGVPPAAMFYQYPHLSQQYYVPLSQGGYGAGPYPPHMMDPYSRSYGEPPSAVRYQAIDTPDLFDDDTEFYQERSPDNVLQQRQQTNGYGDSFRSPEHSSLRPSSPDRFTETSDTSSYAPPPPGSTPSHTHEDSITSAHKHFMDEFVMDGAELQHYGYGGGEQYHGHVPTYPGDMLNRAGHIPHEAYRDVYQGHGDMGMPGTDYDITHGQTNGHYYNHYTSPTASAVPAGGRGGGRRPSRSSYASSSSDHAHLEAVQEGEGEGPQPAKTEEMNGSSTKNRVSWSTEVIEYQRTPSDLAESDFDFNQF